MIDASRVAVQAGLRGRTNSVLQTCFFALSDVLPRERAIAHIKHAIEKTYGKRGEDVVERNFRAVDAALENMFCVTVPSRVTSNWERQPHVPASAPQFVREVTALMLEGRGDEIPVSALPVDGTWPSGTAVWEKRNVADTRRDVEFRTLHPVRPVQLRLPAWRHPGPVFRRGETGWRTADASSRSRSTRAASPMCASPCSSRSRTALAACCAWRPVRRKATEPARRRS